MNIYQYRPDLSIRFAPRASRRLRSAVNRICRDADMAEASVLRYGFEAVVLMVESGKMRLQIDPQRTLDSMLTVRTSALISRKVQQILKQQKPDIRHADVLRALLELSVRLGPAERHGAYRGPAGNDALDFPGKEEDDPRDDGK